MTQRVAKRVIWRQLSYVAQTDYHRRATEMCGWFGVEYEDGCLEERAVVTRDAAQRIAQQMGVTFDDRKVAT